MFKFKRNDDAGNGGGGGEGGTTPPPAEGVAAPPPPAGQPDVTARLAQLEVENKQLLQYAQQLQTQVQAAPAAPPPSEDEIDLSQVDPTTVKLLNRAQQSYMQRLESMQEQMDYMNFTAAAKDTGTDKDTLAEAERIYQQWKANGFRTTDARGQLQPPSRMDALVFAEGHKNLRGKAAAQRKTQGDLLQQALNQQAITERPGSRPPPGTPDIDSLPRDKRLEVLAARLDEEGF